MKVVTVLYNFFRKTDNVGIFLRSSNTSFVLELVDFRGREFKIALKVLLSNGVLVGCFLSLLHE